MMRSLFAAVVVAAGLIAAPVPKDRPYPPPTRKQLQQSQNNLKQIGWAVHNYHDVYGFMPNNVYSKNGKPLLSWRVLLLPSFEAEEQQLYKEFKLDEPWDSAHNKKLIEKMPKLYAPIRVKAKPGETFYRGFTGPDTVFEAKKRLLLTDITDGTSNTTLVVEAGEPVIWTKPDDLPFDPAKPLPRLGGLFDGTFHLLTCDGAVHTVMRDFEVAEFKKLITRSGGEVSKWWMSRRLKK
jgi:hypothetical protein